MISPFGVEHTVNKSFKKLLPKLSVAYRADKRMKSHRTFDQKISRHALEARMMSGETGSSARRLKPESREKWLGETTKNGYAKRGALSAVLREQKSGAHGIYEAISRNNRKNRGPLP